MKKNKISKQQDDLDSSSSWLLYSQNPTDHNIDIFSNLEPEDSEVYLEEWQNKIVMVARHNGYIKLYHLVYILAKEEGYSDILPKLWEFFHLNREIKLLNGTTISDKENRIPKWIPSWIETAHSRANPWYWILLGWTIKPYFHAEGSRLIKSQYFGYIEDEEQDPKKGIDLYRFVNRQPKEVNDDEEQSPTQYINLSKFEEYVEDITKIYQVQIPLPKRLYPDQESRSDIPEEKESQKLIDLKKDEYPAHETFIKNLRISYESDYEVMFQEPRKSPFPYNYKQLNFRDQKVEWRTLLDILKDPDHTYCIKSNAERKRLERISAKIVKTLNRNYPVKIPEKYNLFELCHNKKPRTYRFKFKVNSDLKERIASSDEALSTDQLLDMIEKYHNKLKILDDEDKRSTLDKIDNLMKIAKQKGISENEILYRIKEDEEDIRYDPHENEKPEPKGR